jgi:hypothetical protein
VHCIRTLISPACVPVSERMYREYETLKNKHDVQSRVMEDAMKSASQVTSHGSTPCPQDVSAVETNEDGKALSACSIRLFIRNRSDVNRSSDMR